MRHTLLDESAAGGQDICVGATGSTAFALAYGRSESTYSPPARRQSDSAGKGASVGKIISYTGSAVEDAGVAALTGRPLSLSRTSRGRGRASIGAI